MQKLCFKIIISSLFLFLQLAGKGQVTVIEKHLQFSDTGAGISSICYYNDTFYLPAEKRPVIYRFDHNFKLLDSLLYSINVPFETEGCTFFNEQLYLLSEDKAALYRRNSDGTLDTILGNLPPPSGSDGMEGVTTNRVDKFYLLLERKLIGNKYCAVIYTYEVKKSREGISLQAKDTALIKLPSKHYRYSDILYEPDSSSLLLLKSREGDYAIERIKLDKSGLPDSSGRREIIHTPLTLKANDCAKTGYDNNLEGLTLFNNNLYIVSDNCYGSPGSCKTNYKTLLLVIFNLLPAQ